MAGPEVSTETPPPGPESRRPYCVKVCTYLNGDLLTLLEPTSITQFASRDSNIIISFPVTSVSRVFTLGFLVVSYA